MKLKNYLGAELLFLLLLAAVVIARPTLSPETWEFLRGLIQGLVSVVGSVLDALRR